MPDNTYKRDIGIKYNFAAETDETDEKKTDDVLADSTADDDDDAIYDEDFPDGEQGRTEGDEAASAQPGYSVLSERERKYIWEQPPSDSDKESKTARKRKKAKKARRLAPEPDDDENYDFEIGYNAAGLKIIMGLMLITFIVIISILVYQLNVIKNQADLLQTQLDEAPSQQEVDAAKADASAKDQTIAQLTLELNQYKVDNTPVGQLVETPEGSVYVVAANDTLGKIAQEYQVSINQIMEWNNMDDADSIKVGQKLIVRKADNTADTTAAAP